MLECLLEGVWKVLCAWGMLGVCCGMFASLGEVPFYEVFRCKKDLTICCHVCMPCVFNKRFGWLSLNHFLLINEFEM